MSQTPEKFQGDGFVIENYVIKGDEKHYDIKEINIGQIIFNTLSETPEHIGQIEAATGKKKTFAEIKEKSTRLAGWLRQEAIGPGDVVSLCSPRHPDAEIIFYATSFVGAAYTPFVHNVDLEIARHYIKATQPRVIFTHKNVIDILENAAELENHAWKIIIIDTDGNSNHQSLDDVLKISSSHEIDNFQVAKVNSENTCVIFSTSGTTGSPKFIPLTDKNFIYQVLQFDVINGKLPNQSHIILTYFYPGWILQMLVSTRSILLRQTLVFHKNFEPHETCKIIEKYKVNTLIWDVYMIALLAESDLINKYDLKSVKCIHSVGSKLFDVVRGKMLRIFPNVNAIGRGLGIMETGLVTLFTEKCRNPQSEGTVVPNVQLKIVDTKTGLPLEHNKNGELCVKSPCMMTSYYNDPTRTKLAFDDEGCFRTGDEAYYDETGEIIVVGRLKEIIKYRETELRPFFIEQTLLSHPDIIDAAVVGIFHQVEIEQPIAYVQVAEGSIVSQENISKLAWDPEYGDIFKGRIIFSQQIPRTANGKINRQLLREHAEHFFKSNS